MRRVSVLNFRSWPRFAGLQRFGALALLMGTLSGCGCGQNDSAISALRKMPSESYASLFQQAELVECKTRCEISALNAFRDLATRRLVLTKHTRSKTAEVVLKFCFDEGISLKLRGLGTSEGSILVSWGGSPPSYGEQLLWSRPGKQKDQ